MLADHTEINHVDDAVNFGVGKTIELIDLQCHERIVLVNLFIDG